MQDRIKRWTRELMMIPGLSGFEGNVRRYIKGELAELGIKSRTDRSESTRLNSSHSAKSRMPSSA